MAGQVWEDKQGRCWVDGRPPGKARANHLSASHLSSEALAGVAIHQPCLDGPRHTRQVGGDSGAHPPSRGNIASLSLHRGRSQKPPRSFRALGPRRLCTAATARREGGGENPPMVKQGVLGSAWIGYDQPLSLGSSGAPTHVIHGPLCPPYLAGEASLRDGSQGDLGWTEAAAAAAEAGGWVGIPARRTSLPSPVSLAGSRWLLKPWR